MAAAHHAAVSDVAAAHHAAVSDVAAPHHATVIDVAILLPLIVNTGDIDVPSMKLTFASRFITWINERNLRNTWNHILIYIKSRFGMSANFIVVMGPITTNNLNGIL